MRHLWIICRWPAKYWHSDFGQKIHRGDLSFTVLSKDRFFLLENTQTETPPTYTVIYLGKDISPVFIKIREKQQLLLVSTAPMLHIFQKMEIKAILKEKKQRQYFLDRSLLRITSHPPPILLYWKQDYNSQNSKAEYDNEDWVSSYLQTPLSISLITMQIQKQMRLISNIRSNKLQNFSLGSKI